jgi:DNA-binding response OmpR family regulator/two-component sensor histidine kinase
LSLIISPLEQVSRDRDVPEAAREQLGVVQRNAKQLLRLINQLLDMNKIESGNMKVSYSRGDIVQFLGDCVSSFTQAARSKNISLEFSADVPGQDYLFDPDKTEKIVYNILSNAVKFTPENGKIEVQVCLDDRKDLVMKVTDSGIGVSEDNMNKIFSRFYQVDNSSTRRYEGTGIGLALVKELVDLMKGTVTVQSAPGTGSVFLVKLPLVAASNEDVPRWVSPGTAQLPSESFEFTKPGSLVDTKGKDAQRPLVVVVEDNVELRGFISRSLTNAYQVITASNGLEALVLVRQHLPALVLSDVMMPEMDGYTLCKEIKSNTETDHISVILLTAKAASASVIEGLSAGADDYIAKPFQMDELLLRIQNILAQQARLREYFQKQLSDPGAKVGLGVKDHPFIQQLYDFIEKHLDESSFTVELLAQQAAMSSKTLNRKLSSLVGLSANELIRQYRLKRSIDFLKAGNSIAQSAYSVGYESHAHFSTSFKSFYGVTPSEFLAGSNKN